MLSLIESSPVILILAAVVIALLLAVVYIPSNKTVVRLLRAIIVLGLLMAVTIGGVWWLRQRTPVVTIVPMTQVPVLKQAVLAQTLLVSDTLELRSVPLASVPPNALLQQEEIVNGVALVNLQPGRVLTRDQVSFTTYAVVLSQTVPAGTVIVETMVITRPFPIRVISATVASVGIQTGTNLSGTVNTSNPQSISSLTQGSIIAREDLIGKIALVNLEPYIPIESNQVSAYLTVPVLTVTIGLGEALTQENIGERNIALAALPPDLVSNRDELSGTIAVVNIASGVPIARSSIIPYVEVPVPKYVIAAGTPIDVDSFYLRKLDWRRITTDTLTTTLNITSYTAKVYLAPNEPITISTQLVPK